MTSTINADKIMNSSGDQDSGLDLLVNDQVKIKTANTDRVTVTDATTTIANNLNVTGNVEPTGSVRVDDGQYFQAGNSYDLQMYHDGSNSYVEDQGTGDLRIKGSVTRILSDQINLSNNANTLDGLTMDSAGRINKPKAPYFFGGRSAGQIGAGFFVSNVSQTNTGSHYNTSNGLFTAPVTGRYYCMFGNFVSPYNLASNHYQVSLRVNSSSTKFYYFYHKTSGNEGHTPIHFSDVITLAANDTVGHYIHGSLTLYGSDWTYATQAFYLLG
tara:strand:+ start:746 stop:1558 length:813 start_codon:yes stop_codon:yes gene_type:complete